MKSFSSSSFASDDAEILARAAKVVAKDPQALFTDFQWYLYAGRDTVFYTCYSKTSWDQEAINSLVAQMVALAPQLTHGFVGAKPGQPFPKNMLDAITSVETVDSFEGYPDKMLGKSLDLFEHKDLPLFRVEVVNRRGGPDEHGRAAIIQVRSAHSLLEGSDSALLNRSQSASHGIVSDRTVKVPLRDRVRGLGGASMMAGIHLFFAHVMSPEEKPWGFKTLAVERQRLRLVAQKFGVTQRAVYFALVTKALFAGKPKGKKGEDPTVTAAYTLLGGQKKNEVDDDFFRVHIKGARFTEQDRSIADYVLHVEKVLAGADQRDVNEMQVRVNTMFSMHRRIHSVAPWIYGERFWRFGGRTDVVLTLVPPHRTYGPLSEHALEPIYCGAHHPSSNIVTYCPGREYMTMSFSMEQRHLGKIGNIDALLAELEAAPAPERKPKAAAEAPEITEG